MLILFFELANHCSTGHQKQAGGLPAKGDFMGKGFEKGVIATC
jgi:hypothetical protein